MDAIVFFDDVLVPWERVFLLGDVELANNLPEHTNRNAHSGHQVVTKQVVKAEFILGLANLMVHTLGSSSLMALPTEADLHGPLAPELQSYLDTNTASAEERIRLFRLAWDTCCSAFASRQVLYERYFGGNILQNSVILYHFYDKEPMTTWVRQFLAQE